MSNHTPQEPSLLCLAYVLNNWVIEPIEGRIYQKKTGNELGYVGPEGYVYLGIRRYLPFKTNKLVRRTHLVWWSYHGEWPQQLIDHDDRVRTNDSIDNLNLSNLFLNRTNSTRPKKYHKKPS
jgi:hypothetical protein